jgi:tellurium resistance protein TerZ
VLQTFTTRAIGEMDAEGCSPGFLIPVMKNLLSDLIPGCKGSSDDRLINLGVGEAIAIESLCSTFVNKLSLGLKWEAYGGKSIDLDASCLMLDSDINVIDSVHFEHLKSECGSVVHGGDTTDDKKGDEDDEQIHMTFALIPDAVTFVVFVITSYSGDPLSKVQMCSAHFFETESKRDLVLFEIGGEGEDNKFGSHTAVILCIVFRFEGKWYFLNASECSDGKVLMDNLQQIKAYITDQRVRERQREQNERLARSKSK